MTLKVYYARLGNKKQHIDSKKLFEGGSGVHRLFEGQRRKEGHFSARFCHPRGQFIMF